MTNSTSKGLATYAEPADSLTWKDLLNNERKKTLDLEKEIERLNAELNNRALNDDNATAADVYYDCARRIDPLTQAGHLPFSLVDSVNIMAEAMEQGRVLGERDLRHLGLVYDKPSEQWVVYDEAGLYLDVQKTLLEAVESAVFHHQMVVEGGADKWMEKGRKEGIAKAEQLVEASKGMQEMCSKVFAKVSWRHSAMGAEEIRLLNEAPLALNKALNDLGTET